MDSPSVYTYTDFRQFLADWQVWKQTQDPAFSRSEFSRRLGLPRTRSFLNDVLRGKTVTPAFVERFEQVMGLPREDARFFRALVGFNQASTPADREMHYEQLVRLNRTPQSNLDAASWDYYRDWHHAALRCALDAIDWDGENPARLARRLTPRFTPGQIRASFQLLKEMGMIARRPDGIWKPVQRILTSGAPARDERIRQHQLDCLALARDALLSDLPEGARDTSAAFLAISGEAETMLRRRLAHFRAEVRSIVHKDTEPATRMVHLGIQLFPMLQETSP
ncbi:MAG: TIGR02147 family protein [Fibrobacteria bacterium]|nr:TIGR02147 family protein [Fibrobacteria bacterium]